MRSIQEMEDGTRRIRPLLSVPKKRLIANCKQNAIPYVIDPSNTDLQYDRNRARFGVTQIREGQNMDLSSILNVIDFFQIVSELCFCKGQVRDTEESVLKDVLMTCCEYSSELGIARLNCNVLAEQSSLTIASGVLFPCLFTSFKTSLFWNWRVDESFRECHSADYPVDPVGKGVDEAHASGGMCGML